MKQRKECLETQNNRLSTVIRRYFNAGFSTLLQTSTTISLIFKRRNSAFITGSILITLLSLSLSLFTGATNLFGLNGSAYAEYTISMTSSGAQSIDILPDASNVNTSISVDAVTVTTTCPAGYNLTTTTSVNDNKLYLNGSSSNNATDTYFNPSDGTTALSNAPNTWGFYQDGSTVPTASSVFKPVPISTSTPATIRTSSSTSDSFNIYYGVAASSSLAPGTYKMIPEQNTNENGTIVYYLTMAEECIKPYMQDVTDEQLDALMPNVGDSTTLYDKRDEQPYTIAKLADNKYWTVDNLNLGAVSLTTDLNSSNSNIEGTVSAATFNSWEKTTGSSSYTSAELIPVDGTDPISLTKYGTLYNYCAASAGTICTDSNNQNATSDLCPAGWRLPTGNTNSELNNLYTHYNTPAKMNNSIINSGAAFSRAGYFINSPQNQGVQGRYWSSTRYDDTSMSYLVLNTDNVDPASYSYRRYGRSIRCIKKTDTPSEQTLYDLVAAQSKAPQTLDELRAAINTSNSGVYEYNGSIFGLSSDASNDNKIYYYRGILDNTVGTRGSDGDNAAWPNTVVLSSASDKSNLTTSDTCWRIVRTTGSGGVKMIYQGKWDGSTCAKTGTSVDAISSVYFNRRSSSSTDNYDTNGRIIYVGYSFSSTASHQTDTSSIANSNLFVNGAKSNLRTKLESWYNNNMTAWTNKLEASAGWCNDRTTYSSTNIDAKTTSNIPYSTSKTVYFGAYLRNRTTSSKPTLGCPNETGEDLLTTSNGLGVPSAPLTADEAAFAGSGYASSSTPYHANSYLRSGTYFWLLSPSGRSSSGDVSEFYLYPGGYLRGAIMSTASGVRPSISLVPGIIPVSGTGTAADPWIVNPEPINVHCTDSSTCMQNVSSGCDKTLTDGRDGNTYTTATIAGTCWMTQNLRFQSAELKVGESDVTSNITLTYSSLGLGDSYTEARIGSGETAGHGTYYNACAASANELCNNTSQQNITRSVCPAGWKLPTQAQLGALPQEDSHFTGTNNLAGYYTDGSLWEEGVLGFWWGATASSAGAQYGLYYEDEDWIIDPSSRDLGLTVRCVRAS
ncbi:hypothetical protein IKD67_02250 [Candidatus Saccharibacteria bacterium]|nr:hypothetical protein [Candidatus Saccharibacteria bacterium]